MDTPNDSNDASGQEFSDMAAEHAKKISEQAKSTAQDFTEQAKETFGTTENKRVLVGILAILLGSLGVHKFILGYKKEGYILLGMTLAGMILSCVVVGIFILMIPGIIGLIEGIVYLTKSDEEFYQTYQIGNKTWF